MTRLTGVSAAELVDSIRQSLRDNADAERAASQRAYMKSALPFWGVPVPTARSLTKQCAAGIRDAGLLREAAEVLWRDATHREERYAATTLLGLRPLRGRLDMLDLYEEMIRTGAWWDLVDEVAGRVGDALSAYPQAVTQALLAWSADDDMWIRRTSIIAQLRRKTDTDRELLTIAIESNGEDTEFFIRKAIGWALREYAKTDAEWVRTFVATHPELSGLSKREALKHIG